MLDVKQFGLNIKHHREALKLSCFEFAIIADINYSALANIERGNIIPTTKTMVMILNALDKTFKECMNDSTTDVRDTYKALLFNSFNLLNNDELKLLLDIAKTYNVAD